jgi:uncharacterized protein (DUF305 family)
MNTGIKVCTTILAGFLLVASCENKKSTTATHDLSDSSDMTHHAADPMTHDTKMDTMAAPHGLMTAMNSMMDKMGAIRVTGDFDIDFANMMIEHHKGAIEMANIELTTGTDAKMKTMAQSIITKQTSEIKELGDAIAKHKSSGMKHAEGFLQKSMTHMKGKMGSMLMSNSTDKDFATMMIFHHEEAITMAKAEVQNAMNPALKKMAQKIITDQTKEIGEFKKWLAAN